MATNEARKNANRKWDRENMMTLACRVPRVTGMNFKALAEGRGTTPHQLLKEFVLDYVKGEALRNTDQDTAFEQAALDAVRQTADRAGVSPAVLLHAIVTEWVADYQRTHESVQ